VSSTAGRPSQGLQHDLTRGLLHTVKHRIFSMHGDAKRAVACCLPVLAMQGRLPSSSSFAAYRSHSVHVCAENLTGDSSVLKRIKHGFFLA
jgi:hypothetical protein